MSEDLSFKLERAITLAKASQVAYSEKAEISKWAEQNGYSNVETFDQDNVQGFYCSNSSGALLVFRGTSNPGQWVRDARFFPARYPWGRIHIGFRNGIQSVEQDLLKFDEIAKGADEVLISGHSLGGALAVVAASRLKINKGVSASVYTYGQPRVGLGGFADRFSIELPERLYRLVNQSDIVTRLPPGLIYRHTGTVKRIVMPGVLESVAGFRSGAEDFPELDELNEVMGRLTGFAGGAQEEGLEALHIDRPLMIETDLAPLSEGEFLELQSAMGAGMGEPDMEDALLEGAIPFFADHAISEYIRLLEDIAAG